MIIFPQKFLDYIELIKKRWVSYPIICRRKQTSYLVEFTDENTSWILNTKLTRLGRITYYYKFYNGYPPSSIYSKEWEITNIRRKL